MDRGPLPHAGSSVLDISLRLYDDHMSEVVRQDAGSQQSREAASDENRRLAILNIERMGMAISPAPCDDSRPLDLVRGGERW